MTIRTGPRIRLPSCSTTTTTTCQRCATGVIDHIQDSRSSLRNQRRIRQVRKFNPMSAVRVVALDLFGDSQRETGLATARGACQRDQP